MQSHLRSRTGALSTLALLLLAACAPPPPYAPAPPPVPAAFVYPMRLVGTEPFWGATIHENHIMLSGVDRPELHFPTGQRTVTGAGASWRTTGTAGAPLFIELLRGTCSDGMSDRVYPFSARVVLGDETLRGCAITEAEFLRQPRP